MRILKNSNKNLIDLLGNKEFKEKMDSVITFFNTYIHNDQDITTLDYKRIQAEFRESDIQSTIRYLSKNIRKIDYILTTPFAKSLSANITSFIKMEENSDLSKWIRKWKALSYSYLSFISSIKAIPAYQKFNESKVKGKKSILAISLLYPDEDNIKANDEIKRIFRFCEDEDSLFILPVYGCSFNVFLSLIEMHDFDILHVYGHGNQSQLCFVNGKVGNKKFISNITGLNKHLELGFLNCCETYSFVQKQKLPFSNYTISYDGEVSSYLAYYTSESFYRNLVLNRSIPSAWKEVGRDIDEINLADYYLLS